MDNRKPTCALPTQVEAEPVMMVTSNPYTAEQVSAIVEQQVTRNKLATRLAFETGVKAGEIASLRPPLFRAVEGEILHAKGLFAGLENIVIYTVENGRHVSRRIAVSKTLAEDLEASRLARPMEMREGKKSLKCFYDIGSGHAWVKSIAEASYSALGLTYGTQGLRHAYIHRRAQALARLGFGPSDRVAIIAIETGLKPGSVERYTAQ